MTRARCGREDAHGGHWIGRQPSGAPFCAGNRAIVAAVVAPRWTVEPGRALHCDGVYAFGIMPADRERRAGLDAADLDAMAHRLAALLNAADL